MPITYPPVVREQKMIDTETFDQILEMDDDDEQSFSRNIIEGFFEQAQTTFKEMDVAIVKKDLPKLSSLGHFLKGSSASLGLVKLKDSCERIQNLGMAREGKEENQILIEITDALSQMKRDYETVKAVLADMFPGLRTRF